MTDEMKLAKAGDMMTPRATSNIRKKMGDRWADNFKTREACTVQSKGTGENGQWMCITCGEFFQNNMGAHHHTKSHKRAWWTGEQIEEA